MLWRTGSPGWAGIPATSAVTTVGESRLSGPVMHHSVTVLPASRDDDDGGDDGDDDGDEVRPGLSRSRRPHSRSRARRQASPCGGREPDSRKSSSAVDDTYGSPTIGANTGGVSLRR